MTQSSIQHPQGQHYSHTSAHHMNQTDAASRPLSTRSSGQPSTQPHTSSQPVKQSASTETSGKHAHTSTSPASSSAAQSFSSLQRPQARHAASESRARTSQEAQYAQLKQREAEHQEEAKKRAERARQMEEERQYQEIQQASRERAQRLREQNAQTQTHCVPNDYAQAPQSSDDTSHTSSYRDDKTSSHSTCSSTPANEPQDGNPLESLQEMSARAQSRASTVGVLLAKLSDLAHDLIRGEIALAKAQGKAMVSRIGQGVVLLIVATVLELYFIAIVLGALIKAFALIVPGWAASLIVAAILFVIILILTPIAVAQIKKGKEKKPEPQVGIKKSVQAVKKGLQ